jgi:hypothetical protein
MAHDDGARAAGGTVQEIHCATRQPPSKLEGGGGLPAAAVHVTEVHMCQYNS